MRAPQQPLREGRDEGRDAVSIALARIVVFSLVLDWQDSIFIGVGLAGSTSPCE
jgi:hypothetical protein